MSIKIEINEAHVKQLMEFYIQRIKVLKEEITERERESKELNESILQLRKAVSDKSGNVQKINPKASRYNTLWPWFRKIEFAINHMNKPISTREIIETLSEFEPSFLYNRKKAVASISSVLSTKSGKGKKFIRKQNDIGEFIYTLAEQYDMGSSTLEGFTFDEGPPF